MISRRDFLKASSITATTISSLSTKAHAEGLSDKGSLVNDIHSQLNPTLVSRVVLIENDTSLQSIIASSRREGKAISIAGGRHAMGGQQFGTGTILLDTRKMNRIYSLDSTTGIVEVDAGIEWPELVSQLISIQKDRAVQWGIAQKQTGADRLTLGGALSANVHGRGLQMRPIIEDIESFSLVNASGELLTCSRTQNRNLFNLAIGGYGLFGVITRVRLRLKRRRKVERIVTIVDIKDLMGAFQQRIAEGYLYGDCQFSTDMNDEHFTNRGVFSCYRPLPDDSEMPDGNKTIGDEEWRELYYLSHADTAKAYQTYSRYYLSTSGQRYWSDTHQMSIYHDNYHHDLDRQLKSVVKGSEMISELYVPREALSTFMEAIRTDFRQDGTKLIYGTIRLIEKDNESFLAWAKEPWACIVMNLHVDHDDKGISNISTSFRKLIDRAIYLGGSYFLTYHRWAKRQQVETCYPQLAQFLRYKKEYDPDEVFQSDWYRHYRKMLSDQL